MADYVNTVTGARVSVADDVQLDGDFELVTPTKASKPKKVEVEAKPAETVKK